MRLGAPGRLIRRDSGSRRGALSTSGPDLRLRSIFRWTCLRFSSMRRGMGCAQRDEEFDRSGADPIGEVTVGILRSVSGR
jgi:hypothetical protein